MTADRELKALLGGISLESLKDHAKALHRDAKVGGPDARQRIEPYFDDPSILKLQQAQLVIAREHGFKSWRRLKSFIEVRDARNEAQREFTSIQTRMAPSKSLMAEYDAAMRRFERLTKRLQKARPDLAAEPVLLDPDSDPGTWASGAVDEPLLCSFCHKSQHQVPKLVAGPAVFICNECVDLCVEILAEDAAES